MKRMMALMLTLAMLAVSACAEEAEPLFPAKGDNSKWGYINREGVFVIAPQFDAASEFRGDYAVISVWPEGYPGRDDLDWEEMPDCEGVIDRGGNIIVEPVYSFDAGYGYEFEYYGGKDTGIWTVTRWNEDDNLYGFFDIPSGCFSGLRWDAIYPWVSESRLIPVIDDAGAGYADRTTGELVIPCQFFDFDPSNFIGGVAAVAYIDEEGNPGSDFFLIDETGAVIPLPEGIHAVQYQGAFEGRVMIENDDRLFGFADAQGTVVIPPQFIYANPFEDGFAVVQFPEGDWACVDPDGKILVRGLEADHWSGPEFENGLYARRTGDQEFSLINMRGETVMTFSTENLVMLSPPDEDGVCVFQTDPSGEDNMWEDRRFGLVDLTGRIVAEPVEDFEFGDAPVYENGLACVSRDGRCGYIDTEGREVYFWDAD